MTRIFGGDPIDTVFARTTSAVEPVIVSEVLGYNQLLLDAISFGDWDAYAALTDADVTCFEPEAADAGLVRGMDFHKHMFAKGAAARAAAAAATGVPPAPRLSTMHDATVRLLGPKHALVAYTRLVSPPPGSDAVTRVSESRLWRLTDGRWRMLHFHRSRQ